MIQYVEPEEGNHEAIGLDVASEPKRRLAALRAARSGEPALTAPITLVQAQRQEKRGFLLLLPIFDSVQLPATAEERWQSLLGWAYTPLVIDDVLAGVDLFDDQATLSLYDVDYAAAPLRFYATPGGQPSAAGHPVRQTTVDLYGRQWLVEVRALPSFLSALNLRAPGSVGGAIVTAAALLSGLLYFYLVAAQRRLSATLEAARSAAIVEQEAAQRRIVRRFQLATDAAGLGVAECDPEAGVVEFDARCAEIYDLPAAGPVARDAWLALLHPDDRMRVDTAMHEALRGGQLVDEAYRIVLANGELRWVRAHGGPQVTDAGQPRLVSIHQDVTAQTLNSLALEKSERFLAALADNLPSMVAHFDRQSRCTFANRALADLVRRARQEVAGQPFDEVMGAAFHGEGSSRIAGVLAGEVQRFEVDLPGDDGATRYLWVHYVPDLEDKGVGGFYAFIYDVSEVRLAERRLEALNRELLRQKSIAEEASQAKGLFLANMSHEIRTPMNAILGLAYLLDKGELTPQGRETVRKIQRAGQLLLGILNDILDFSKIEANRLELSSEPFSLQELLDDLAGVASLSAGKQDLEVVVEPAPRGIDWLIGDALRLRQVMTNLTSNAIKFTERGEVDIGVALLRQHADRVLLEFAVRDTGIGIDADKLREIFSPFTQADPTTTRRFGGTGLGLAISCRLVELMGGTLEVYSVPGAGSRFTFQLELPLAPALSAVHPVEQRLRVLVADDHPLAREALQVAARALGWTVDAVDSGEAAERQVRNAVASGAPYEVLLLDWHMPGIDGLAAAANIREALQGRPPPVILMVTAAEREALLAHAGSAQVDGVITKPVTCSTLLDAYLQVVGERRRDTTSGALPAAHRLAGLVALVVDDSDINREVALSILEGEGARILLAADGQQAVELLQNAPRWPDVVLMDIQMPVLDGYEATRRIRAMPGGGQLPVIALTAGAFRDQHEAAVAAGMNGFVTKPFQPEELIGVLQKLVIKAPTGADASALPASTLCIAEDQAALDAGAADGLGEGALALFDEPMALRTWRDPRLYREYLQHFIDEHGADAQRIAALLDQGNATDAAAAVHRLGGAAVALALRRLTEAGRRLERLLRTGNTASGDEASGELAKLAATMADTLAAVRAHLAGDVALPAATAIIDPAVIDRLRTVIDTDNPGEIERVIASVQEQVPAAILARLQSCLDEYDFRGAERVLTELDTAHPAGG